MGHSKCFENYSLFTVSACKVVIGAIKCCVSDLWRYCLSAGMEKGRIKYLHTCRHYAVVLTLFLASKNMLTIYVVRLGGLKISPHH